MKRFVILSVVLLSTFKVLYAQTHSDRLLNLKRLQLTVSKKDSTNQALINEFILRTRNPKEYLDENNNRIVLTGFDQLGHPKYTAVDNAGAAVTTGVKELQVNGSLGLNLQGEGIFVGVWDEGIVPPHQDFQERILSSEGANLAVHATHVTGTIIGSGEINSSARGMAPKAKAYTFDFNNDESEMLQFTKPDQSTLLFSNHSYGLITGWRFANGGWTWFGNQNISNAEDYRFGFYDSDSKLWDEILYNSPYYTVVKSAGNDRTDTGSGTFPADCNGGSGYDCLGNIAVVKNLLTIGAVNKLSDYSGPASVVMSSFSSWGPTDDGRIKPDLVAAGVGLLSTSSTSNTAYTVLSGTSMATPNTTGSLILLQELKKKIDGDFMKAATLKALAIHTAKEAGPSDGPDYAFGWGLVDVEEGAKTLLNINGSKNIIKEESLGNSETFVYQIEAKANTKVTVTIAWTDPAANPVGASLDPVQKMLVNDLDLFITDTEGNTFLPWCLDPTNLTRSAFKSNNSLDNVEKVEFIALASTVYTINVNHKSQLRNGAQDFSLVTTYSPIESSTENIFWVGGTNTFQNPQSWASSPKGLSDNLIPDQNKNLFITDFSSGNATISLQQNEIINSLNILTDENIIIDLAGYQLTINDKIVLGNNTSLINGTLILNSGSNESKTFLAKDATLTNVNLILPESNTANWQIIGNLNLNGIILSGGSLTLAQKSVNNVTSLIANSNSTQSRLSLTATKLQGLEKFDLENFKGTFVTSPTTSISLSFLSNDKELNLGNNNYRGQITIKGGKTSLTSELIAKKLQVLGDLSIAQDIEVDTLEIGNGISLTIADAKQISSTLISQSIESSAQSSITSPGNALINLNSREIFCLNNLTINNVSINTESIVALNPDNTLISNSTGWQQQPCANVALADFEIDQICLGGLLVLQPTEYANIDQWEWRVNDDIYTEKNPSVKINDNSVKNIELTITTNTGYTNTVSKQVPVINNTIADFSIVYSNGKLISTRSSASYQWLLNNEILLGKVTRDITPDEAGTYQILIRDNTCNKLSNEFIITSTQEEPENSSVVFVWPNPFDNQININLTDRQQIKSINMFTIEGKLLDLEIQNSANSLIYFNTTHLAKGVYFLKIVYLNNRQKIIRLIK